MQNETVVADIINKGDKKENMSGTIDLYYFNPSPPCRSVMMMARAVGVNLNLKTINILAGENLTPEYLKINPQHTIPVLNDNGFILKESRAIIKYLADQYASDDTLNPKDPKKAAIVNERLYFDASTLHPRLLNYYYPVVLEQKSPDPEKAAKFEEALEWLNEYTENQTWIAGQNMTVADFAIIATISTAEAVMFDITKYPNIQSWYERTQKAMEPYGYEEINVTGTKILGNVFKNNSK